MAKFREKIRAQKLRRKGQSIKEIAKKLGVSKGTASIWCRDIKLTKEQIARLDERQYRGGYKGRLKGAKIQRERYLKKVEEFKQQASNEIKSLNKRDLLIAGIGLYWGEGSKKGNSAVRFYNSDPRIISFMMKWFKEICHIPTERFAMYVNINEIHKDRLDEVKRYWSRVTKIPLKQFRKPVLIKAKNKKVYTNFRKHFGTLSIRITKSSNLFYKIQGYMDRFYQGGK